MENTRAEMLKDSIEETQNEIENFQLVVQKLTDIKDKLRGQERAETEKLIHYFDEQLNFLEDILKSDENTLNLFC